MSRIILLLAALTFIAAPAVAQTPAPDAAKSAFRRPATIPFPADNPYSLTKATLGKMLFFDPRLSSGGNVSCASCHNPSLGWEAGQAKATGTTGQPTGRHSPTVLNLAWANALFWDGRAASLEDQARGPITHPGEMNMPLVELVKRLKSLPGYVAVFNAAFPGEGVTETGVLKALATYERTIVSGAAPFDRWIAGDAAALSPAAQRGFGLFVGKANCAACHSGWNFTDNQFHDIGLPTEDEGRKTVTGADKDQFAVKTPGLRNVAQRAPYMHTGEVDTLELVIRHYMSGGVERPTRSPEMKPFELAETEIQDLLAFLNALTGADAPVTTPILPY